jgi:threonyl-tRNA synthetase
MLKISFPDGRTQTFKKELNGFEIADSISKSLSKKAVAIKVNGVLMDLCDLIKSDSTVEIITLDSDEGLEIMRHTIAAQVLAKAIKNLYPNSKLAIGPTIQDGFYYDVLFEEKISIDQFPLIENEMKNIIQKGGKIVKSLKKRDEALKIFQKKNEIYKVQIIEDSEQNDNFQLYQQGDTDFVDLCRGPHLHDLKKIGAFKLTKLAGAYWRGDSNNEMLQRIYGTAWKNDKDLDNHLFQLEEAEKRDHRKLGKELDLYHFQEEAAGSVFWHPKGWTIYKNIMSYIRKKLDSNGYKEVNTPQLLDRSLWEDSGHWEKFRDEMFISGSEDKTLAIKPMNCPCHVQIFKQGIKSYKELPLRMAEFGCCHRNEPSGALHGLMRLRSFVQDDAHIFCTEQQIISETSNFCNLLMEIYKDFGFEDITIKFSDRPKNRAGNDEVWDQAEKSLMNAVESAGYNYELNPGEGAFYGPKLEFVLRDAIGRDWQCGTLQVDFVLPERLNASYIGEDGQKHRPVMLHRAILGSFERFIGILIENYSGRLPAWLSPVQVALATINSNCNDYANEIASILRENEVRCITDFRNEKLNYKLRELSLQKINFIAIIGDREFKNKNVVLRTLGSKEQEVHSLDEFIKKIKNSCRID